MMPLKVIILYIIASLSLFAFGPWPWPTRSSFFLYAYIICALIVICWSYKRGIRKIPKYSYSLSSSLYLYRLSVLFSLLLFWPTLTWRAGENVTIGWEVLADPSRAYFASHSMEKVGETAWIEYIRMLFSLWLNLLIPLLVVFWGELGRRDRIFGIVSVLAEIYLWVAVGTNKGIADVLIGVSVFTLMKGKLKENKKSFYKKTLNWLIFVIPMVVVLLAYFTLGQIGRHDGQNVQTEIHSIGVTADRGNLLVRDLPNFVQDGVIAFSSYIGQGYNGLALCLEQPFVPTWGVGNSRFLVAYFDKYFGLNIEDKTYPARTEQATGWDSSVNWHTIFPWFASDVSFFGALIVVGVFSFWFAMAWRESIECGNPYALGMVYYFSIMFFYISANNQVMQTGSGFIGFWSTWLMWRLSRKRRLLVGYKRNGN